MRIAVAAGSASTGGKREESTIEERILSNDTLCCRRGNTQKKICRRASLLLNHVPVVLDIVGQLVFLNGPETCASQILSSFFFPPHRPQSFTALRQGYGHAVQTRDRVEKGSQWMINVFVHLARPFDVLHQIYAVPF